MNETSSLGLESNVNVTPFFGRTLKATDSQILTESPSLEPGFLITKLELRSFSEACMGAYVN